MGRLGSSDTLLHFTQHLFNSINLASADLTEAHAPVSAILVYCIYLQFSFSALTLLIGLQGQTACRIFLQQWTKVTTGNTLVTQPVT